MHERPIEDLVDALRQLGAQIEYIQTEGYPPLKILPAPMRVQSVVQVRGDVSSQFLTALLLALPLVSQDQEIVIEVVGELISKPYVLITLKLLAQFGVHIARTDWQRFTIPKGSLYRTPGEVYIEADASSASYFIAAGALSRGHLPLKIEGIGRESIQGDIEFVKAARAMGADIQEGPNSLLITPSKDNLKGIDLDCNHIPDAAMTLVIMALFASTPTTLRNIGSWRVKETDRIKAMSNECAKLGAKVLQGEDWIEIHPIAPGQWRAASIHTYDDHRIAMCFALASLNPQHCPVRILDPRCVGKTFPDFFETFFSLAHTPSERIPVICIDGPTASGKGTLASLVAKSLGYGYLDSGALYRITAWHASNLGIALTLEHQEKIAHQVSELSLQFEGERIMVNGQEVSEAIRSEAIGMAASQVSAMPVVRQALFDLQRNTRRVPGLVADGRDMGSVIFPDAELKIYLTADAQTRAKRRHKQLISKGFSAKLEDLLADLEARDLRDTQRTVAPLKPAVGAVLLDNAHLTIEETVEMVLKQWQSKQPF
jgi:3-phosphoshikimate 1-carboxyvinyltransferase